ncbi:uncharacterized protein LOC112883116 [Panicum hallii]|nr:uncharacterized protein LOC112883116 [Panicum hallii]
MQADMSPPPAHPPDGLPCPAARIMPADRSDTARRARRAGLPNPTTRCRPPAPRPCPRPRPPHPGYNPPRRLAATSEQGSQSVTRGRTRTYVRCRVSVAEKRSMACQQLRSTSLPVRPHALVLELEDELQRLRSGAAASAPSPAALAGRLGDAYGRIEELVRLPGGRDALSSARWRRAVEAGLDASVALLDLCERARDAAASAKQHVRAARRALRRGDTALARAAVRGYARCLAKAGKQAGARKALGRRAAPADAEAPAAVKVLSEAVAVTVAVLQGVLSTLSARVVDTRKIRWCVVSKLMRSDWSLCVCRDLDGEDGVLSAQETLQELEDSVEAVESGLEHLFRQIVQSRVALLNVLTL